MLSGIVNAGTSGWSGNPNPGILHWPIIQFSIYWMGLTEAAPGTGTPWRDRPLMLKSWP